MTGAHIVVLILLAITAALTLKVVFNFPMSKSERTQEMQEREAWRELMDKLKEAGCPCGQTATSFTKSRGPYPDAPRYYRWTCEEHKHLD